MTIIFILSFDTEISGTKKVLWGVGCHLVIFALMILYSTKVPQGSDGGPRIPLVVVHVSIVI